MRWIFVLLRVAFVHLNLKRGANTHLLIIQETELLEAGLLAPGNVPNGLDLLVASSPALDLEEFLIEKRVAVQLEAEFASQLEHLGHDRTTDGQTLLSGVEGAFDLLVVDHPAGDPLEDAFLQLEELGESVELEDVAAALHRENEGLEGLLLDSDQ